MRRPEKDLRRLEVCEKCGARQKEGKLLWSSDAGSQALGGVPSVKAQVKLDPRIKSTVETH